MYHEIYLLEEHEQFRGLTNPAYNTEVNVFRKQMNYLFKNKIKTLTIEEFFSEKSYSGEQAVCLTFDDGWLGNYLHAFPILRKFGFKATFFIATDLIGKPFYMTWEHLMQMQEAEMSIQSHTVSHRPLIHMGEERILFELSESKRIIEDRLGKEVKHLSLPHGMKDEKIGSIAREVGYKSICTSNVGFQNWEMNGPWLKRVNIGDRTSEKKFQSIMQGKNKAIWAMMTSKTLKNTLKQVVGVNNYRKLYQWVYRIK